MEFLTFSEANHPDLGWGYEVYNDKEENIASIRKVRTGRFMHWNLVIEKGHLEAADYVQFSPGCQDEIREMCRKLNAGKVKK